MAQLRRDRDSASVRLFQGLCAVMPVWDCRSFFCAQKSPSVYICYSNIQLYKKEVGRQLSGDRVPQMEELVLCKF